LVTVQGFVDEAKAQIHCWFRLLYVVPFLVAVVAIQKGVRWCLPSSIGHLLAQKQFAWATASASPRSPIN
jgi:hypothetical protein